MRQGHVAIVLAAGGSQRLGRPKQQLTINGESLLARCVRLAADTAPERIIVVLGACAAALREELHHAGIANLHKIGFSTTSVEQRIKNAEKSPTYLMAPVKVVEDYRTYNLKPSALEHLLHRVFAEVRLDLSQVDREGRNYDPSEWFVVSRNVINQAINMILSGEIVDYVYDPHAERLVARNGL